MPISSEKLERVKVLIVDDYTLFAAGTVALLSAEPRILAVGIAKNGIECMDLISKTVFDVVLLDINLPDICGIDLIDTIKKVQPEVNILMLTGQDPKIYVTISINKGAHGFLHKNCSVKEMIQGILRVYKGGVYFPQGLEAFLQPVPVKSKTPSGLLTTKEIKIIKLVSKGLHNKEIASSMGINIRTVESHVSNILFKLEVGTRFEALLKWAHVGEEEIVTIC